jgi:hypothetical protein
MKNKYSAYSLSFFLIVVAVLMVSGCKTIPANAPSGFAAYQGENPFRAVSPDGVMYRVRTTENKPSADLSFWKTALKKHMTDSGYHFISESDVSADTLSGYQLELTAPMGDKDYTYLIALFVKGDTLIIAEASGEISSFKKLQTSIDAAIKKIN